MTWTQSSLLTQGYCLSGDEARALRFDCVFLRKAEKFGAVRSTIGAAKPKEE